MLGMENRRRWRLWRLGWALRIAPALLARAILALVLFVFGESTPGDLTSRSFKQTDDPPSRCRIIPALSRIRTADNTNRKWHVKLLETVACWRPAGSLSHNQKHILWSPLERERALGIGDVLLQHKNLEHVEYSRYMWRKRIVLVLTMTDGSVVWMTAFRRNLAAQSLTGADRADTMA